MAQAKKKSSGTGKKKSRGWLLIVIGLGIGVAATYLGQLVIEHNLHRTVASWFKRELSTEREKSVKKEAEKPKSKFDFYTILPETDPHSIERGKKEPKISKPDKPAPEEAVVYILQAGSFETVEKADRPKAELALQGFQTYIQKVSLDGKGERHRVLLGPYSKAEERDAVVQQLSKIGIKPLRMMGKKSAG